MEGWITLHRKLLDWEWYDDIPVKVLFLHLLLKANYQPTKWRGQTVDEGELITSISSLSEETGLSIKQVRTALEKLQSTGEIVTKRASKGQSVKVQNYGKYQGFDFAEGQTKGKQRANEGQAKGKQAYYINNNITNKQDNNITSRVFTAPSVAEVRAYCIEKNYQNVDAEQFVDFYSSKGWLVGKSKMKDWKAAVRTWERRHIQEQKGKWSGTDSQYDGLF